MQSCWEDVQQSVLQSGSGMGGSGAGGGVKIGQAFVFRLRSDFELEMLLQYANGKWGVPSAPMNQPTDANHNYADGILRLLRQGCSGGQPIPFEKLEPCSHVDIPKKIMHHLVCPQWTMQEWNGWQASPAPGNPLAVKYCGCRR